jgi:Cytidylate kinase-like family
VIVGRAGAYIHRDQDDILMVFLVAQESFRVAETLESLGLSKADALEHSSRSIPNRPA